MFSNRSFRENAYLRACYISDAKIYRIAFILVIYALMQFHWNQICLNLLQTFSVQFA